MDSENYLLSDFFFVIPVTMYKITKYCYLNFHLNYPNSHFSILFLECVLCLVESIVFAILYNAL